MTHLTTYMKSYNRFLFYHDYMIYLTTNHQSSIVSSLPSNRDEFNSSSLSFIRQAGDLGCFKCPVSCAKPYISASWYQKHLSKCLQPASSSSSSSSSSKWQLYCHSILEPGPGVHYKKSINMLGVGWSAAELNWTEWQIVRQCLWIGRQVCYRLRQTHGQNDRQRCDW